LCRCCDNNERLLQTAEGLAGTHIACRVLCVIISAVKTPWHLHHPPFVGIPFSCQGKPQVLQVAIRKLYTKNFILVRIVYK
jgi:hypothetical protein